MPESTATDKPVVLSQGQWLLERLRKGPVTAIEALEEGGCFRLAARVRDLRVDGHVIATHEITLPNGKRIAQYSLVTPTTQESIAA